jgi:hypothetical protein
MPDDRLVPVEDERLPRRPRRSGVYLLLGLAVSGWMGFLVLAGVLLATRPPALALREPEAPKAGATERTVATIRPQPAPRPDPAQQPAAVQPEPVVQPLAAPQPVAILTTYEERRRVQERVRQADAADHEDGNVSAARSFYAYPAAKGWAPAALALAFTYDPNELQRRGVTVLPDAGKARACYLRARELMNAAVAFYLSRLPPGAGEKC